MSYSFAYNNSSSPSGTTKFAKLQIGGNNREYTTYGGLNWYASAPYNGKFLIVSDTYSQGWTTEGNATPTFWRSADNTLDSLKNLVNQLPDVNGITGFTDVSGAINYINSSEKYLISQESDSYPEGDIVTSGLVFNLDAGYSNSYPKSGTTWYDIKGTNNGTLTNGPTFSSADGGSIVFDGVNDYCGITSDNLKPTDGITQECWFKSDKTSGAQVFIGRQYGTSTNNSYALWWGEGGNNSWNAGINIGGSLFYMTAYLTWETNKWYHFVHTYNGSQQKMYVNGIEIASENRSGLIAYNSSNLITTIGCDFNGSGHNTGIAAPTDGNISNVKIYNRGLSASEVLQNYNAQKGRFGL